MKYSHKGNAKVSTLAAGVSPTDLAITAADLNGWPDGSQGPFWASIDKGLLSEEKILCSGRSGNVLQVWSDAGGNGRGMDDTVAQTHGVNASIEHVWTATEAEAASAHIAQTDGAHGYPAASSIVTTTGSQDITGAKTLTSPVLHTPSMDGVTVLGGTLADLTEVESAKVAVTGVQPLAEFRVRNTYIGSGAPSNSLGSDGDLYIDKG